MVELPARASTEADADRGAARPWRPQRDARSYNVVRNGDGPTGWFYREFYVTPGKSRPRRWPTMEAAQAFADTLNRSLAPTGK